MVIRYSYIKKINNLIKNDTYYSYWFENWTFFSKNSNNLNFNKKFIKYILKDKTINFFRYFFWIFSYYCIDLKKNFKINFFIYIKYYKYLLNYIYLLKYLKINNIKYYNLYYTKNILLIKKNKKIQRKLINFLILKKNVQLIFFFKQTNFKIDFFFESLNKNNLHIYEINLLNPNFIYFFFYLNFFN